MGFLGFGPTEICINRDELGAPTVELRGVANDVAFKRNVGNVMVSISHAAGVAVACAVALKRE